MANAKAAAVRKTLLKQLVATDFKLRYQGSILGYLWSLLKPMMMFGVLYVVFTYIIPTGKDVPHFPAYLLLGIVMWTFFVEGTTMGLGSVVGRGDLVKKVSISKVSIVIASVLSAGVNFLFNMLVVIVFMIASGATINFALLPFVPLLLIELIAFVFGLALILSALYVRFRDMAPIWEIVLQIMFYATPIIYPLTMAADRHMMIAKVLVLNPLAQIMQDLREILITPITMTGHEIMKWTFSLGVPLLVVIATVTLGWVFFNKQSDTFVENL